MTTRRRTGFEECSKSTGRAGPLYPFRFLIRMAPAREAIELRTQERFGSRRILKAISILFCGWIEHGQNGRLCDLSLDRRRRRMELYCWYKLQRSRLVGLRRSYSHSDRALERFRAQSSPRHRAPRSTPLRGAMLVWQESPRRRPHFLRQELHDDAQLSSALYLPRAAHLARAESIQDRAKRVYSELLAEPAASEKIDSSGRFR